MRSNLDIERIPNGHLIRNGELKIMKSNYEVQVLLIDEKGRWIAQCLEYDFVAQANTMTGAMDIFVKSFAGQIAMDIQHGKEPLTDFTPAPVEFWDKFRASEPLRESKPFRVPEEFVPGGVGFAQSAVYA